MVMNKTIFDTATEEKPERRLTALEYRVRDVLIATADDKGYVETTTIKLAAALHASQPKTSAALVKLARIGLVDKIENGVYRLSEKMARSREMATQIKREIERERERRKEGLRVV